jgi:hypothetical protein
MQTQHIFTIEKSFWHWYFQRKASFIYHGNVRHSFSHLIFKTQTHFGDSENALFGKFEGQKTVFRSKKHGAKAPSKFDKWLLPKIAPSAQQAAHAGDTAFPTSTKTAAFAQKNFAACHRGVATQPQLC